MGDVVDSGLPCIDEGGCGSSDALALYEAEGGDGEGDLVYDARCYSCGTNFSQQDTYDSYLGEEYSLPKPPPQKSETAVSKTPQKEEEIVTVVSTSRVKKKSKKEVVTKDQVRDLRNRTSDKHNSFRGVDDKYHNFFGIRSEYVEGEMVARHYPVTNQYTMSAYKKRVLPKDFTKGYLGLNSNSCDMFGQYKFKDGGKYCVIVGGEEDTPAAYKMLNEHQNKIYSGRGYADIAVVSPTNGEGGAAEQVAKNYNFFDKFQIIVVCMDQDKAGEEATKKVVEKLPAGKIRIMTPPAKDACECLEKGMSAKFINSFYEAKFYSPAGVLASSDLLGSIIDRARIPRIKLPPFLRKVNEMLCGGLPLGYICNILSASGTGKTTIINEMLYYFAMESTYLTGVVSLEASAGEYAGNILSRHLGKKIELISDMEEKIAYLESTAVQAKAAEVLTREDGTPSFFLLEDRGDLSSICSTVEMMIRSLGCKIIVIDPISDLLDSLSLEDQSAFMAWEKKTVQRDEVTFLNVCHSRKSQSGAKAGSRGGELDEESTYGSSSQYKSAAVTIIIERDKLAEEEEDRNTSKIKITKARGVGNTGSAGEVYYDNKTHTLWCKEDWDALGGEYQEE